MLTSEEIKKFCRSIDIDLVGVTDVQPFIRWHMEMGLGLKNGCDLGNLASADEAVVNESADISAKELYEILPMSFGVKAGSFVANEVLDITLCDSTSCGDCEDESTGCEKIYAVTKFAGGSPATIPDIVFTIDGGPTWYSHDIDSLTSEDPTGIDCLGSYVIVISNASNSLHYVLKSTLDGLLDPTWTEVTTGFVTGGEPNAIFSIGGKSFIVGDLGYIYETEDPTAGVTVLIEKDMAFLILAERRLRSSPPVITNPAVFSESLSNIKEVSPIEWWSRSRFEMIEYAGR